MVSFVIHFKIKIYTLKKHVGTHIKHFRARQSKTINIWGKEWGFRLGWEIRRETFISHFISFYYHLKFVLHMHILFSLKFKNFKLI